MSLSDRPLPYQPRGTVDGCVADTESCKKMAFYGRWGSSCGTPFVVKDFIEKNMQWKRYAPYLVDRPTQPWTYFIASDKTPNTRSTNTNTRSTNTKTTKRIKRKIKRKTNQNKTKRRKSVRSKK